MRTQRRSDVLRSFCVYAFACSLLAIFFFGNYLMIYRPSVPAEQLGFIYLFPGKGRPVFVSARDYAIVGISVLSMIGSMIGANYFHRFQK